MSSINKAKPEFITTNSYTLVEGFLTDIFDRTGPHNILIINPHDNYLEWELSEYLSIKYCHCMMDSLKTSHEYIQNDSCDILKYSHRDRHNQIFHTNFSSLDRDFIKSRLDNPWTHVILVPSDQFTQVQIQFLQRKFQ